MIYFIQTNDNQHIKIGKADDPIKRLATLQTGFPHRLKLLAVMPGSHTEESILHQRFAALRLRGEWFRATHVLVEFALKSQGLCGVENVDSRFLHLATLEPKLIDLYQAAALTIDNPDADRFCANAVFFGYEEYQDRGIKARLCDLVGWDAESYAPQLKTEQAYDLAYDTIYEALPDCRNCSCL